ncbi:cytochrome P450 [Streptomyces spiramenti]|uniref:Cytochrome P450 n=1 Tax=Streptomyces spiramenti TaxID=2720606 RepID=A0ABX1AJB9_9ACTN|nr:cytochrome P450 [Streptomyces spiramenti]NJP65944.1 cytochrome P450 [Streptomyces spiramenti]
MPDSRMSAAEALTALSAPGGHDDPYPLYEVIRRHGDVVDVAPGRLVVTGYRACDAALRDPLLRVQDGAAQDATRPGWRGHSSLRAFAASVLFTNPPDHGRVRSLLAPVFAPARVRDMRPVVEEMTDRLLDGLAERHGDGTPLDLVAEFTSRLPMAVVIAVLGFPAAEERWFRETASAVAVATDGRPSADAMARADTAMDELTAHLERVTAERRSCPREDLVTALTRVHDDDPGRLGREELTGNLMVLLTAGFETTNFLLGQGVLQALACADHARRLREDPGFAAEFVEETLRLEPPVHVTSRRAAADTSLEGRPLPAGTRVTLLLAAANRDPARFPDPGRFVPGRSPGRALSFGAGGHFCLGAHLARLEATVALPRLLRRFPGLRRVADPVHRDRWVVRGPERLPVSVGGPRSGGLPAREGA